MPRVSCAGIGPTARGIGRVPGPASRTRWPRRADAASSPGSRDQRRRRSSRRSLSRRPPVWQGGQYDDLVALVAHALQHRAAARTGLACTVVHREVIAELGRQPAPAATFRLERIGEHVRGSTSRAAPVRRGPAWPAGSSATASRRARRRRCSRAPSRRASADPAGSCARGGCRSRSATARRPRRSAPRVRASPAALDHPPTGPTIPPSAACRTP